MNKPRSFIPRDKPKSWVIGVCSGLIGMGIGLAGFAFSWFGFKIAQGIAIALFASCWLVALAYGLVFVCGFLGGRYHNLEPKDWDQQVW